METYFSDLRESNEFLNLLLDNMNSAVLIADENLQIRHINDTFLQLFAKSKESVLVSRFGKATGCAFAVRENKPCGETSHCETCVLRRAALETLVNAIPVDKQRMERVFYIDGNPVTKYLDITTRHISFQGRKMILVILYDVTEIETQKLDLQKKQRQIELDLKAAAGIQRSLLPEHPPGASDVAIAWHFEPCSQVGGDIFNIQYPQKGIIDLYMLDVCGHGVAAALIAVSVSQFLQSRRGLPDTGQHLHSPQAVLDRLEQDYPFERFDTYFTLIYMTIDIFRGTLKYSAAGHPPPLLLRAGGGMEILNLHGPAIGLGDRTSFNEEEITLEPGDMVVLYTDGILDAENHGGELYGKQRFYEALRRSQGKSVHQVVGEIYRDVKLFADNKEFADDLSLLVMEFTGAARS